MTKRAREPNVSFDNNGYAIVESEGLKFKWNVSEKIKKDLKTYPDEFDVSVIVTVFHKFMVDVRDLKTDKQIASEFVEVL